MRLEPLIFVALLAVAFAAGLAIGLESGEPEADGASLAHIEADGFSCTRHGAGDYVLKVYADAR